MSTPIYTAAVRAWCADMVAAAFAPLWQMLDNPLANGTYCPGCGARLDKPERPCPMGCKR